MAWTLRGLIAAAGVEADVRSDGTVTGVAYDSRAITGGELYCCIPGRASDGHEYAQAAVRAGAAALLVERFCDVSVPQAKVSRVRPAMGEVAAAFNGRPCESMSVAAVTGTNGKTTVTYLLESIIRAAGHNPGVVGTIGSRFNGRDTPAVRTTPESPDLQALLASMREAGVTAVALEATSDGLEQGRLAGCKLITAGFTNLTQDHLNTHGSMEAYFRAKSILFHPAYTSRAVINVADAYGRRLVASSSGLEVLTYGTPQSGVYVLTSAVAPDGISATLSTPAGCFDVQMSLVGRYNLANLCCAAGMALHMGYSPGEIAAGAAALERVPGRLEKVDAGQPFSVLVDYAHTPDALHHAAAAARELAGEHRLIVVFGCGGDRDKGKRPQMGAEATAVADLTIVTSDNPRSEDPMAIIAGILDGVRGPHLVEPDRREAIAAAVAQARPGDVVLIAGKGHETGQIFAGHTVPFDDREVAAEALRGIRL